MKQTIYIFKVKGEKRKKPKLKLRRGLFLTRRIEAWVTKEEKEKKIK